VTSPLADDGDTILSQLAAGTASPVLVADFQAFSSAPRLSQLISDRAAGRPVYQVDPLAALSHQRPYVSLADLAAEAVGSFARSAPPAGPAFVVGYCSAAALSLHIAALLARTREATAILLRPYWPDDDVIRNNFAALAANLGAPQLSCPELDDDPDRSVRHMEKLLGAEMESLVTSQGLDPATGTFGELLLTYRSWLAFLVACRNDSRDTRPGAATAATAATAVIALSETPDAITVPGLLPGQFKVCPLIVPDPENPVTPEVADTLVAQLG
jgi:hypothetical protein